MTSTVPCYRVLRTQLHRSKIQQEDIAHRLKCSIAHVSALMTAKAEWRLDECYTVLGMLGIPKEKMYIVFPEGGKWAGDLDDNDLDDMRELIERIVERRAYASKQR